MPDPASQQQTKFNKRIYLASILATMAIILPIAIIHHVFILDDFTPTMLLAPVAVSCLIGSLLGTILWLRQKLSEQNRILKLLADSSREFTYVKNQVGNYLYISPSVNTITGYTLNEFIEQNLDISHILHEDDQESWAKYQADIQNSSLPNPIEIRIKSKNGTIRWINHFSQIVYDAKGSIIGTQSSNIDITERKKYEARILHMADYDPLTDLPNRRYLMRHLLELTNNHHREHLSFAVLFMDLNRFKYVNDAHGHSFGDKLLQEISKHLKAHCQPPSLLTRFGGDEFVIIIEKYKNFAALEQQTNNLVAQIEQPICIDKHTVNIGASIGIAIYPYDGTTPETLIKNADTAMFKAKKAGLNYQSFSTDMAEHAHTVLSLESQLRDAIQKEKIELHYQPQFSIDKKTILGVEALARWTDPDGNSISPQTFISIAEETGLIIPLGRNLMRQALTQAHAWHSHGHDIRIAVNVSARQFLDKSFISNTLQILNELKLPCHLLEVELTESALLEDRESAIEKLQQLRDHGISIALDDFGTGHSSLSYLHQLPIHTLKIDRSFILGMLNDKRHEVICRAITRLAHELELKVVAEGIETETHLSKLKNMGCDIGQGYLLGRPAPAIELETLLRSQAI